MLGDILKAGKHTGSLARARRLVADLRRRLSTIARHARGLRRVRVFCMEWFDPIFTTGHWVPEMVRRAGGSDVLAHGGESHRVSWNDVRRAAPEKLILMPCGLSRAQARREAARLRRLPGWRALPAVRDGEVFLVDGPSYFNGAGPRLVDGVAILAEIFHPEIFPRRRPSQDYERFF